MKTNPYEYNTDIPWAPQQNQVYEGRRSLQPPDAKRRDAVSLAADSQAGLYVTARPGQLQPPVLQNQRPQPGSGNQKPRPPEKMPKARALALVSTLKKWLVVASIVGFGSFSGLVALHQVGSTTTSSQSSSGSTNSSSSSSSKNSNSFLNQQGGNTSGTSSSSTSSSSSSTVSGTHTS